MSIRVGESAQAATFLLAGPRLVHEGDRAGRTLGPRRCNAQALAADPVGYLCADGVDGCRPRVLRTGTRQVPEGEGERVGLGR